MEDKRGDERKQITVTTTVRKALSGVGYELMEFKSKDLCLGGIFISSEDLSLFDLGEELEILVDDEGQRYYTGQAKVARSARIVSPEGELTESGYGLMFTDPDEEFKEMIRRKLMPL